MQSYVCAVSDNQDKYILNRHKTKYAHWEIAQVDDNPPDAACWYTLAQ